jgi:hypothetical protein
MATRSTIAKVEKDGSITAIYCHWDGYPSHNGKLLLDFYNEEGEVDLLLSNGSLSILGKSVGEKHDFDSHLGEHRATCLYYHRDRGEEWEHTKPTRHANVADFLASEREEYTYLWTPEGWRFGGHDGTPLDMSPLRELTREDCEE